MRRHPEQCHRKVVDRLTAAPRLNVGRRVCGTLDERSKRRGRLLLRLWAECPCRIALWAARLGQSELPRILLVTDLLVLRAGQRGDVFVSSPSRCQIRSTRLSLIVQPAWRRSAAVGSTDRKIEVL